MKRLAVLRTQGIANDKLKSLIDLLDNGHVLGENKKEMTERKNTIDTEEKLYEVLDIIKEIQLTGLELDYFLEAVKLMALDRWIR